MTNGLRSLALICEIETGTVGIIKVLLSTRDVYSNQRFFTCTRKLTLLNLQGQTETEKSLKVYNITNKCFVTHSSLSKHAVLEIKSIYKYK